MSATDIVLARQYLRIGNSSMDVLVQALIDGAEEFIEGFCGVGFGEQIVTDALDGGGIMLMPQRRPVRHIISIKNRDAPDVAVVEDTDYYILNDALVKYSGSFGWLYGSTPGVLLGMWTGRLKYILERWMVGRGRWLITYNSGYQISSATTTAGLSDSYPHYQVPNGLRMAILHMIRRAYDARGGVKSESAEGWSVTWDDMLAGDIGVMLSRYMRFDA